MALTTIKTGGLADNSVTDAKVADAITVTGAQTGITQVGTLTAGTWNGTAIASAYLDADTAHLSGSTFTGSVQISHGTTPDFTLNDTGGTTNKRVFRISGGGDAIYFEGRNNDNSGAGAVGGDGSIMSMSLTNASTTFSGNITLSGSSTTRYLFLNSGGNGGVWQEGNHELRFGTNDTERMKIESDGTVVMNGALQPAGNITGGGYLKGNQIGVGKTPSSGYEFDMEASSGNANMRLKATGANQGVRLDLDHHSGDKAEVHFYNGGHSSTAIVSNEITNGLLFKVGGTSGSSKIDAFSIASNGAFRLGAAGKSSFSILSGVAASGAFRFSSGTNNENIHMEYYENDINGIAFSEVIDTGGSQVWKKYNAAGNLIQSLNQNGLLAVIGTELYIQPASSGSANLYLNANGSNDARINFQTQQSGTFWSLMMDHSDSQKIFFVDENGNDGVFMDTNNTAWQGNSDERMKENLVELDGALANLNTLRCVNFNMKHDKDNKRIGLIAQDVYKVYPEATSGSPDNEYSFDESRDGNSHKGAMGLRYTEMIPPMIKAIQELSAKVEALENA